MAEEEEEILVVVEEEENGFGRSFLEARDEGWEREVGIDSGIGSDILVWGFGGRCGLRGAPRVESGI